jgi:hypothetical protein
VDRRAAVRLIGTGRALLYDWGGDSSLPGALDDGDPFGNLFSWDARLQGLYLLDESVHLFSEHERWAVFAEGGVKASFEEGSPISKALRPRGGLGIGFRWRDRIEMALGVTLSKELIGSSLSVGPLVELDWKIDDRWSLRSYGLGAMLERRLGDDWSLYALARLEGSSYRLDDRGGTIGTGAVHVRQLPVGVGIRWDHGFLVARITVGAMLLQRIKIRDGNDDSVGSETAPASPFVTVRIDLRS